MRRIRLTLALAVALMLGATVAFADHLIPKELGASTVLGEGSDGGGQPADPVDCFGDGIAEEDEVQAEACVDPNGGFAGAGARVGHEEPGDPDPNGDGVGRFSVTVEGGERRLRTYVEDFTPGNLVMNGIEEANDRSSAGGTMCRLLPDECSQPGQDDQTWDTMLFTPMDLESTTLGPQSVSCAASGTNVVVHDVTGDVTGASTASPCLHWTGSVAFEPTMGFTSDGSLFYQTARPAQPEQFPDVIRARPADQWATWQVVSPKTFGENRHQFSFDPVLYVDPTTSRVFTTDFELGCTVVSHSDDGGGSWTTVPALCGTHIDHQTIFAGPPVQSTTVGYDNIVYYCTPHVVGGQFSLITMCSKSLDGGLTFVPTGTLPFVTDPATPAENGNFGIPGYCDGMTGRGAANPVTGRIFVPKGYCGEPHIAYSDDEGATWTVVKIADTGMARTRDNRPDHEVNVAVDAVGNVYATWVGRNRKIRLAHSQDGGLSWTTRQINVPGMAEADRPDIEVGATGQVVIVYVGTSTALPNPPFPGEGTCPPLGGCPAPGAYATVTWNAYMTVTENALEASPVFVTATINDPSDPVFKGACGPGGCLGLGDGVTAAAIAPDGTPWGAYFDACPDAACATVSDRPEGIAGRLSGISLL